MNSAYRSLEEGGRTDWRVALRLFRFVLPHRWLLMLSIAVLVSIGALTLVRDFTVKLAVDGAVVLQDLSTVARWIVIYLLLATLLATLDYVKTRVTILTGQRVILDVRGRLFHHIHRLPLSYLDRTPVGTLVTRVTSDVEALAEMFSSGLAAIAHDLLTLVLVVLLLFWIDAPMAIVSLAALPVVVAFSLWFGARMRHAFRAMRRRLSELNGFQQEAFSGISVTRLFRREGWMQERFEKRNEGLRHANFDTIFNFSLFWPTIETLSELASAGLLVLGASRITGGHITWGTFFFFWLALGHFFRPIRELSERFNILQAALAAAERIFSILDVEPEEPDAPGAEDAVRLKGAVELRHVRFAYDPAKPVLRDLSFRVEPGETVALVGPTGAGKTSIISLLSRLWDVEAGAVLIDGRDVREYRRRALRARIAVVMQDVFLFNGTIAGNLRLGNAALSDEAIRRACELVHADRFIERMPGGYDAEVRERGNNLSVGQKQLIAFARALAVDPDILILDEATSSIDTETEMLIQAALRRLVRGRTAIVIAHRLSTVREADRILCLHHGHLVEQGTHEELLALRGLYARLHELTYAGPSSRAHARFGETTR